MCGAFPEIRTRNIWYLKPARLPVAPGRQCSVETAGMITHGLPCRIHGSRLPLFSAFPLMVPRAGVEPAKSCPSSTHVCQFRHLGVEWSRLLESNWRPARYECAALPSELNRRVVGASRQDRTANRTHTKGVRYQLRHRSMKWRPIADSNRWLPARQAGTLAAELMGHDLVHPDGFEPPTIAL